MSRRQTTSRFYSNDNATQRDTCRKFEKGLALKDRIKTSA